MATNTTTKTVPQPREWPLLGSLPAFLHDRIGLRMRMSRQFPNIGRVHIGPRAILAINSAPYIHNVLVEQVQNFDKQGPITELSRPVTGRGLLTSPHVEHDPQRKLMQPMFTPRNIAQYAATMVQRAEQQVAGWQVGDEIDLHRQMMTLTMQIVTETLFSSDVADPDELGRAITYILIHVQRSFLLPIPLTVPTPANLRFKREMGKLNDTIYGLIERRRKSGEQRSDLLGLLLAARYDDGSAMSDQQVRDEAMTIFLAGHETTANAMTWASYLLATHPGFYAKAQVEVDSVLQGRAVTLDDLPKLPYTLQVFKEAMRLYPPAHILSRFTMRDSVIDGYAVAAGTLVVLDIFTMHRRPDYFPQPEQFDPDRFSPQREKLIPKGAYLPFGNGSRVCIGNHFALMEGHLLLATLLQRASLRLVPGQQVIAIPQVTLRPKHGVRMVVEKR